MMDGTLVDIAGWLISALPVILVHVAGIVVAIVLLRRARTRSATLALIAFSVLFLTDLGSGLFQIFTHLVLIPRAGPRVFETASIVSSLCCTIVDAIAMVLLIIAFAQALARSGGDEPA